MMYDHNKKAGNQGDVVKHTALIAAAGVLITESKEKFQYADTFAGYPYNPLRDDGEWRRRPRSGNFKGSESSVP